MRWKNITGTNYKISDTGIVINTKTNKQLKPKQRRYPSVSLSIEGISKEYALHRLVTEYFIENPNQYPIVRHMDNNPANYSYDNLCWGTYSDNMEDAIQAGANAVGIAVLQLLDGKVIAEHRSLSKAASAIGLAFPSSGGASHIKAVCEGRRKSLKGFTFRYKKEGETNQVE